MEGVRDICHTCSHSDAPSKMCIRDRHGAGADVRAESVPGLSSEREAGLALSPGAGRLAGLLLLALSLIHIFFFGGTDREGENAC